MAFVLIFIVAMLIVPIVIDIDKHGRDNILTKSGRDILKLPLVALTSSFFARKVKGFTAAAIGILILLVVFYVVIKIIGFKFFGPVAIVVAGAIPYSFITIVFFVSYLALIGSKRRNILLVGTSFILAVFLTYFLVGCGAFIFLKHLPVYSVFSYTLNGIIAVLAIFLGILSFGDFLKAKKGNFKDIKLQIPSFIKTRIQLTISKEIHTRQHILAAFLAGIVVTLLGLACCTGQVYLPTIILIAGQEGMRKQGFSYLFLFDLMFIMPLVVVFLISYFGTTSEQLARFTRKNIATVKLCAAFLFFALGLLLIATML